MDPSGNIEDLITTLNNSQIKQVQQFVKKQDAYNYVLSKQLIKYGLKYFGYGDDDLNDIKCTTYNKPYLNNEISFNISHSQDICVCIFSDEMLVGADIEKIVPISLLDFQDAFSSKQMDEILKSENALDTFFRYWTRKEAAIKGEGLGMNINLKDVELNDNYVKVHERNWHFKEVELDPGYVTTIVSDVVMNSLQIERIDF